MAILESFEVGGVEFRLAPLPVVESLRVLGLLTEALLPAAGAVVGALANAASDVKIEDVVPKIALAAVKLPDVYEVFANHCEVKFNGTWQKAKTFDREVFGRRGTLLLAWLSECLSVEYADFFTENGRGLLGRAAGRFTYLMGSTAGSGG